MPTSLRDQHEAIERARWIILGREPVPSNKDERYELANRLEEAVETIRLAEIDAIRGRDLVHDAAKVTA